MTEQPITCIILDDEPGAITLLENLLAGIPGVSCLGSFTRISEAVNQLIKEQPDVIFTDIRMPEKSGLELADEWLAMGIRSRIVFVTGFDEYAIKAIKKGAFDYLLKPVDPAELLTCILKIRCLKKDDVAKTNINGHKKIRFNTRSGCIFIDPAEILYVEADVNYSHIFLMDGTKVTVSVNLGKVEDHLSSTMFIRISRSLLINSEHVKRVNRNPARIYFDVENDYAQVSISRASAIVLGRE